MSGIISLCGALTLCWLCVDGQQLTPDQNPTAAGQKETCKIGERNIWILCSTVLFFSSLPPDGDGLPRPSPGLADDIFAVLREGLGEGGELTNQSLTQFGICAAPGGHTDSSLEFLRETSKRNRLQALHPSAGETLRIWILQTCVFTTLMTFITAVSEDAENGTLWLTLDLPPSGWRQMSPVLLLAFQRPPAAGNLQVTFSSRSLQPDQQVKADIESLHNGCRWFLAMLELTFLLQTRCLSADTLYTVLRAKTPNEAQTWRISAAVASDRSVLKQNRLSALLAASRDQLPLRFRAKPERAPDWWKNRKRPQRGACSAFVRRKRK